MFYCSNLTHWCFWSIVSHVKVTVCVKFLNARSHLGLKRENIVRCAKKYLLSSSVYLDGRGGENLGNAENGLGHVEPHVGHTVPRHPEHGRQQQPAVWKENLKKNLWFFSCPLNCKIFLSAINIFLLMLLLRQIMTHLSVMSAPQASAKTLMQKRQVILRKKQGD